MKKFIITEEEKNRILGMHQDHGYNSLNEQTDNNWQDEVIKLNPKSGKKTIFSKLPAVQVSQPNSEIFYTQNRWFQYPKGVTKGEPIIKGSWKLENGKVVALKDQSVDVKKQSQTPALKPLGTSAPNTKESSIGVLYQYEYPNDKKYTYGVKDGKWFGKNLANGKEFDLSTITTTITNLNNKFPNALTQQDTPVDTTPTGTTTTGTTTNTVPTNTVPANTVPKKLTDMSKIELDMMNQKQTLAFNSAYAKLNTFDKEKVNNTIAGK
jgi:hypothetical protein